MGHRVHLTISRSGRTLLEQELGLDLALDRFDAASLGLNVSAESLAGITYHHFADFLSPIASGSALTAGMVICPCSGGTLSAVASGSSTNLVHREGRGQRTGQRAEGRGQRTEVRDIRLVSGVRRCSG